MLLIVSCTNNAQQSNYTDNNEEKAPVENVDEEKVPANEEFEIDRTEYLTGEIITDGNYDISSSGVSSICFVPDKESREIIDDKYSTYDLYYLNDESYFLYYDNISVTENLPDDLGIYKVKVKFDLKKIYNYDRYNIIDILLTDNIGTILYEGKSYETNDLDLDVKVKDRVCGLIVDSVDKFGGGGFRVGFCGEIETEGYYNISYGELHERNLGNIYYDGKYESNVPMMMGESSNKQLFYFVDKEELFSQLEEYSSFGRGKFKISNFHIVYKHGMGREPTEILTEIVSLDKGYENMFEIKDKANTRLVGYNDDFAIVSNITEYDENNYAKSFNFYYINKNIPKKEHLLTTEDFYILDDVMSETEFSLITEGYNEITDSYGVLNRIKCKITDKGVELSYPYKDENEKISKFNLSAIDDNYNRIATDGNYIYYIDMKTYYINRIKINGTGNETISEHECSQLHYYNGKLYFKEHSKPDSQIACVDTDGKNYQIIYGEKFVNNFVIHNDVIYMTVFVEEQEAGYAFGFYKYNLSDGKMEIFDDSIALPQPPGLRLINNKIYYGINDKIREYDIHKSTVTESDTVIDNIQEYNDFFYTNSRYSIMRRSIDNISEYDKLFEIGDGYILRKISVIDDLIFFTYCYDYTEVDKRGIYVDVINIDGTDRRNLFYFDYSYSTLGHYNFDSIYVLNDKLFVISRDNEYPIFKVFDFDGNGIWSLF